VISRKGPKEIAGMREAGVLAAATLAHVAPHVRAGVTTLALNDLCHKFIVGHGAKPAPLNYRGFPKSICTSVNEVVCHGIPNGQTLKGGDIVNVDVTTIVKGWHGDTSVTFYVGEPSTEARHVVEVARRSLAIGIAEVRPGARLGDVGAAIQEYAESQGCGVVRDFVGHGIGREFHEAPHVPHYGKRGSGTRLRPGMTFTIEPMVNLGTFEVDVLADAWTVVTRDRRLSAQFEHTLLVTEAGYEILTRRDFPLPGCEIHAERGEAIAAPV